MVYGLWFRVYSLRFRLYGSWFMDLGVGCRI